ncbi:hypothetical protein ACGFWI_10950 [Streptomyces sp. NPDC048434]|uniref:hypothetical protein n=1 Tax=Streptomyces sp. NPDC048434 TaxID=3365549 RepID=UPI00371DE269
MPAHGGLHGGLSTAELTARGAGVRLRVLMWVWVLLRVLLGVRVRGLGRVSRLRGIRAGRLVRGGTRRLVRRGTGGLLRVGPRRRWGVRVRAVWWWRGGHRESP